MSKIYKYAVKVNNINENILIDLDLEMKPNSVKVSIGYKDNKYSYNNIIENINGANVDTNEKFVLTNDIGLDLYKSLENNNIEIKFIKVQTGDSYFEVYYDIARFCRYIIVLELQ